MNPIYEALVESALRAEQAWTDFAGASPLDDSTAARQLLDQALFPNSGGPVHPSARREVFQTLHWQIRWVQHGLPCFALTHGLTAALMLTDFGKLTGDDFHLPFPAFLIQLPSPDGPLTFADKDGHPTEVRWLTVHAFRQPVQGDALQDFDEQFAALLAKSSGARLREETQALQARHRLTWEGALTIQIFDGVGLNLHTTQMPPRPGEPIERWIADCSYRNVWKPHAMSLPLVHADNVALGTAARLLANLCVYLAAQREQPRETGVDAASPLPYPPSSRSGPVRVWVVGKEVKLPKHLRDAARAYGERGSRPKGWRVHARFIVRGHWRLQACGPGRTQRRQRWIEPFWKGPADAAAALTRLYDVATSEERK